MPVRGQAAVPAKPALPPYCGQYGIMASTSDDNPEIDTLDRLRALDRLQASVRVRNVDLELWERANAAERAASGSAREKRCER